MTKRLKFGLIGCGRIVKNHIEALINNQESCELVALCDIDIEKAKSVKEAFLERVENETIMIYEDYKSMIKNEDIDCVVIATESGYHGEQSIFALSNGKNVLVEKPMALSLEEIDEMIYLAEKNNLKLAVAHQNRFNPAIQKLRKAIEEDRFGRIINGTARILWNRNDEYYNQAPWRGTKDLDGGTLMNQCIHNIDLLQWMMGSEVESLHCERGTFLRNIEMEDFGAILVRFKNKSIGIIEGSACVYPTNLEETLSIFGEKGTVVIGGKAVNVIETWKFEDEKDYDDLDIEDEIENVYGNGHSYLYKDFIEAINEDRKPLIDGNEGRKAVEIILRAYESGLES